VRQAARSDMRFRDIRVPEPRIAPHGAEQVFRSSRRRATEDLEGETKPMEG
jgi:hypothetical protein